MDGQASNLCNRLPRQSREKERSRLRFISRPHRPRASVIRKTRRKWRSPSPDCLRKRRRDPVSPEPYQKVRLRSRVMCPRGPSQCLMRKTVSPRQWPRPIGQSSPLRPPRLDRQSLVGWPRFPADRPLHELAWPTSLPAPQTSFGRWTCVRGQLRARSEPMHVRYERTYLSDEQPERRELALVLRPFRTLSRSQPDRTAA
jgi:hypothetical protein